MQVFSLISLTVTLEDNVVVLNWEEYVPPDGVTIDGFVVMVSIINIEHATFTILSQMAH